jgi:hypothetical protein
LKFLICVRSFSDIKGAWFCDGLQVHTTSVSQILQPHFLR